MDIPPSTVVYYKDKFAKFIPSEGGGGRRRRYPVEVLEIFRRIREMFNDNWSVDQIEQELALKFSTLMNDQQYDQQNDQSYRSEVPNALAREVGTVLGKLSEALEDQSLFRSEIRSLRDEVATLREERVKAELQYGQQLKKLESEVEDLRHQLKYGRMGGNIDFPSTEFLESPLVICSEGEYLGVQGKGRKHFSLKDFVQLIERKMSEALTVATSWNCQGEQWVLNVKTDDSSRGKAQNIILVAQKTITPSMNTVTEIVRLNIDGNDAPDALLLTLFRQLRSVFNG